MNKVSNVCVLAMSCVFALLSLAACDNRDVREAQQNVRNYFEEELSSNSEKLSIEKCMYSDLYILTPYDENKVVKPIEPDRNDEEKTLEYMLDLFDSAVILSVNGCSRGIIEAIIKNDANYRKWKTGAKEYVMISYAKVKHAHSEDIEEFGLCFRLSRDLNIINVYPVTEDDDDYVYLRLFGQTSGRFYGAVDCQFEYLERMYNHYVGYIKGNEVNLSYKFVCVKKLNALFGEERFEYMDDREACVDNCIKQLDDYEDIKVLKNKAYATIKSF